MVSELTAPRHYRTLHGEALEFSSSPTGRVGRVFRGAGMEAVWVWKQDEAVDSEWFSQPMVDLILVAQGQLRVEFEQAIQEPRLLSPGDLLVLPPEERCRANRWPRDRREATVFFAVYPAAQE